MLRCASCQQWRSADQNPVSWCHYRHSLLLVDRWLCCQGYEPVLSPAALEHIAIDFHLGDYRGDFPAGASVAGTRYPQSALQLSSPVRSGASTHARSGSEHGARSAPLTCVSDT